MKERIARALGWSLQDVNSMSLHSLRELVRPVDRELANEISVAIADGWYLKTISDGWDAKEAA